MWSALLSNQMVYYDILALLWCHTFGMRPRAKSHQSNVNMLSYIMTWRILIFHLVFISFSPFMWWQITQTQKRNIINSTVLNCIILYRCSCFYAYCSHGELFHYRLIKRQSLYCILEGFNSDVNSEEVFMGLLIVALSWFFWLCCY